MVKEFFILQTFFKSQKKTENDLHIGSCSTLNHIIIVFVAHMTNNTIFHVDK